MPQSSPIQAIVVHSGGMDSSLCLQLAIQEFGKEHILSLSFDYQQRHGQAELKQAKKICNDWGIRHTCLPIHCLSEITQDALTDHTLPIIESPNTPPNTLVTGRNGLMARLAAIHADHLGANTLFMGILEQEAANSGYRDCSRPYMNKMEEILRIDLNNPSFCIRTPLVQMTKQETMALADELNILNYLWENTITCYNGLPLEGCKICPACKLRNSSYQSYLFKNSEIV